MTGKCRCGRPRDHKDFCVHREFRFDTAPEERLEAFLEVIECAKGRRWRRICRERLVRPGMRP